jgi:hypothetical protein
MKLNACIEGIGLLGPGLNGWVASQPLLAGVAPYQSLKTVLPPPALLPPAERRRSCPVVKLSLAVGVEALAGANVEARGTPAVFACSGGDGENCHAICEVLASNDRLVSPTRFHNSVHNVSAGYWSIATGAMSASTLVCAHDGSFSAGLLEAMTQCVVNRTRILLIAYDASYPEPLNNARPIQDALGIALVLGPKSDHTALATISVATSDAPVNRIDDAALEHLRTGIPAARGLPLLRAIAMQRSEQVVLEYLDDLRLAVDVVPC